MRYLVISDIHANLEALEAVIAAAGPFAWERVLVLGDLVGYGADPNGVCDRIRGLDPLAIIRGNHDKVGAGLETSEAFNAVARSAIRWTNEALTADNRTWLANLPLGPLVVDDLIEICHGTPFDEDAYVFDESDAIRAMHSMSRPLCLFGHTHVQVGYHLRRDELTLVTADLRRPLDVTVGEGIYLVNPGSVGQPRDGDPRAGFMVVDTAARTLGIHRVPYAVEDAQARIRAEGLPEALAQRLGLGR
jgi:diadenosine tetraphosphatase ApaH/serine/threonine PP2A family protein phosphatase